MKNIFIYLILLVYVYKTKAQCDLAQTCLTDFSEDDCATGEHLVPNSAVNGCCPSCQSSGVVPPTTGCSSPSTCLPDGRYAAVQCKGDMFTGRCFCTDEDGNRIFGQMWRSDASEMTCACSRRRAELEKAGRLDVSLHCTRSGNYEAMQCDNGLCWCADPSTGQPTVYPVPDVDMTRLPCYSESAIGGQYLRQCESEVFAVANIHREQNEHGTFFLGNPTTFCDFDGTYGPYKILNGIAYCVDRDGEILGSWQVMSSEMSGMTCNCARDSMIHFPERGMSVTEVCQANGNYQPSQNVGDSFYCVDSDGYIVGDIAGAWPDGGCATF